MLLPINEYKEKIIEAVRNHYVTIISAETGTGKSTQVPQYLSRFYSQVVVTNPRIMATKTLARRVAEEMGVTLGKEVGYKTSYDACCLPTSNILYCTDGLQLVRSIFSKDNESENVLIIDEVQEWNLNIETLVAWCKFMQGKWHTKVVIMSATIETEGIANFFGEDVQVLDIPGKLHDVEVEERTESAFIPTIKENISLGKNILVFVEGKKEIYNIIAELKEQNATILPLHGEMDWDEQRKCFEHYTNSKVIVATNVAQTSLTIPDIDVVVDRGKAKISIAEDGIQGLYLKNISRSDITQRKGRAGRTKNGKYILCSNTPIMSRDEDSIPEIQRSILDRVVLQLATIGLNAEELQFFHQPDIEKIQMAKKELMAIGAIEDNQVTELGYKIVKMPLSVQTARMIVEAEKYGVTEHVIKIAAIIEMGGLLDKDGRYDMYTAEKDSDLIAELNIWNYINELYNKGIANFSYLKIRKNKFFKIKDHIKKLKEVLYGIVEIADKYNKEAIIRSCLSGLVSNIYIKHFDEYVSEDIDGVKLDKNSCIYNYPFPYVVIGIPKTIEFKGYFHNTESLTIVKFASRIDVNTLIELVPNKVAKETSLRYSSSMDAVEVTTDLKFAGEVIKTETSYDKNHPQYANLKEEYEKRKNYNGNSDNDQKVIVIDGKQFKLNCDFFNKRIYTNIDKETLFTTTIKEIILDSGKKVYFRCAECLLGIEANNVVSLRNAVEMNRLQRLREIKKREYETLKVDNLDDVIKNSSKIGKVQLTMNNGGYGEMPIFVYGYISIKKNTVTFKIGDDEEIAKSNTLEALQYIFLKEVEKRYGEKKFSQSKKKVLTRSELKAKMDFDSLVREILLSLTVDNAQENIEFLEEYYHELMNAV